MSRGFEFELPVYVLGRAAAAPVAPTADGAFPVFLPFLRTPVGSEALAVFTDRAAAEQFRDDYLPGRELFALPSAGQLIRVLTALPPAVATVAFDPLRFELRMCLVAVGELVRELSARPG
jgi:hypothetical protein